MTTQAGSSGQPQDGIRAGCYALLADGKRRKYARPKAKKLGHVEMLADGFRHPAIQKLKQGEALSDRELRRALAAFRDQLEV